MAFVDEDLLADIDELRSIPGEFGLHVFTVTERRIAWTGERPGVGTRTTTDTAYLVNGQAPKVECVTAQDILRSGARYQSGDYRVGPLTPAFPGGGVIDGDTDPTPITGSLEVLYNISGPGMPPGGLWCDLKGIDESSMHRYFILRANANQNP